MVSTPGLMAALALNPDPLPAISAELRRRVISVPMTAYLDALSRPVDPEWMREALALFRERGYGV